LKKAMDRARIVLRCLAGPRLRVAALGAVALIAMLLLCWPSGCTPTNEPPRTTVSNPSTPRLIRVRLCPEVGSAILSASQSPSCFTGVDPAPRRLDLPANTRLPITLSGNRWLIGGTVIGSGEVVIRQASEGSIRINDKAYRGQFRLVAVGGGLFDVINEVDIEAYLQGVLSRELLPGWHEETYKAQAIVARTYALYEKFEPRPPRAWDVYADTRSQVYGGMDAETARSVEAVGSTAGIVVVGGPEGREKVFRAYFHSCCGGGTQSAAQAFNEPYSDALAEQGVGTLCAASPRYTWGPVVVGKEELTRRFRAWGANPIRNNALKNIGPIRSIDIAAWNSAGRPVRYRVIDARGYVYTLGSEELRWAVNTDAAGQVGTTLPSGFIETIINEPDRIRFQKGHGSGHGVGMCQWCAQARALAGMRHEDIVLAAYPRTKLLRAY
jgi:stage II sporulation protein D